MNGYGWAIFIYVIGILDTLILLQAIHGSVGVRLIFKSLVWPFFSVKTVIDKILCGGK